MSRLVPNSLTAELRVSKNLERITLPTLVFCSWLVWPSWNNHSDSNPAPVPQVLQSSKAACCEETVEAGGTSSHCPGLCSGQQLSRRDLKFSQLLR